MKPKRDPIWMAAVGLRLKATREMLKLSQADLARATGKTNASISHYENGKRPLDIEVARYLWQRYAITFDWLYRGDPSGLKSADAARIEASNPKLFFSIAG